MQSEPCSTDGTAWIDARPLVVGDQQLAGTELALEARTDELERAALGRDDRVVARASRAPAAGSRAGSRNANSAPSASPTTVAAPSRRPIVAASASSSGRSSSAISDRDHLGVGGRAERLADFGAQRLGVHEVAVVAERDRAGAAVVHDRLRVRPGVAAGRRVAVVADRELAAERRERLARRRPAATRPRSRTVVWRPLSLTAIPADSCPRCWSANSPK